MDSFFELSMTDRREVLRVAADQSGRPAQLLEKDLWVVWVLQHLCEGELGRNLVFKGGSSLSKGYDIIKRFSDDIDLTYSIRAILQDKIAPGASPLPPSSSMAKKWTKEIRQRLAALVVESVAPALRRAAQTERLDLSVTTLDDQVYIAYPSLEVKHSYILPRVKAEFGARATGEPSEARGITCDAAPCVPSVIFPATTSRVMMPTRTFWEKATAVHVYCLRGEFRGGDRFARHWYDMVALARVGRAQDALIDRALAQEVAHHKTLFFVEKAPDGTVIDYGSAVSGQLHLVPSGLARTRLEQDYRRMIDGGLIFDAPPPSFDDLMEQCTTLERSANALARAPAT